MSLERKSHVVSFLIKDLQERYDEHAAELDSLSESKENEQKSSAGDKFETSREMMRQEEEQLQKNLIKIRSQLSDLKKIDLKKTFDQIEFGAFVETSMGDFLIASGIGSVNIEDAKIFCISLVSPVGRKMHLLKTGDQFEHQGRMISVNSVC